MIVSILLGIQTAVIVLLILSIRERNQKIRELSRDLKLHLEPPLLGDPQAGGAVSDRDESPALVYALAEETYDMFPGSTRVVIELMDGGTVTVTGRPWGRSVAMRVAVDSDALNRIAEVREVWQRPLPVEGWQ